MRKGEKNVVIEVARQHSKSVHGQHPGPVTLPGVPWGFSSDKSLQFQSPKKIFCKF